MRRLNLMLDAVSNDEMTLAEAQAREGVRPSLALRAKVKSPARNRFRRRIAVLR